MNKDKKLIFPDFKNCNLNISATLAEFLGAPNNKPTLSILKEELAKNYKNVVFICFDGLGINPIEKNLKPNDFLRKNIVQTLTSTFPSTTTNATTSLLLNKYPLEHGWFGWSMYFEDIGKNIEIFLNTDAKTHQKVKITDSPLAEIDYYFDNANSDYEINTIFPPYVAVKHNERNLTISDEEDLCCKLWYVCNKPGKQFVYAYFDEPDHTMHDFGVTSQKTKQVITSISSNIKNLYKQTKDTLFIITADHGQVDINGYVDFYKDEKMYSYLETPPYMESRAPSFKVKKEYMQQFEEHFKNTYSEDFILFKTSDLLQKGVFGEFGNKAELLGDFIAVNTHTYKQAVFYADDIRFKGHHTSLTDEMLVPLILLKN
ncbi:MAG: alkaline phosphatase family protein [Clostridiales bacterium]|nr:alkaline phosphatase family protein [Clostridiales bacterium]